jgi:alpha/beta superfamily hydrolase
MIMILFTLFLLENFVSTLRNNFDNLSSFTGKHASGENRDACRTTQWIKARKKIEKIIDLFVCMYVAWIH